MPKVRRYLLVKKEYGGPAVGIETAGGEIQVIGEVKLPRNDEPCCPSVEKDSKAAEARARKRAEEEKAFAEMVLGHLNDGLAMATGRRRAERAKD
jgi:hypothetical protein